MNICKERNFIFAHSSVANQLGVNISTSKFPSILYISIFHSKINLRNSL